MVADGQYTAIMQRCIVSIAVLMMRISNLRTTKHHKHPIARQIISAWLKCTETIYLFGSTAA